MLSKADKRFFPFQFRGDEMGDNHGMVSEIVVQGGCKTLTLRSILQFRNFFSKPVDIYKTQNTGNRMLLKKLATLQPEKYSSKTSTLDNSSIFNVPISSVYSAPYEFQFKISEEGENMGLESYPWREIKSMNKHYAQPIQCTNNKGSQNIFLNVDGTEENIFTEKSGKLGSQIYNLDIRPMVIIKNCLPETLHYNVSSYDIYNQAEIENVCENTATWQALDRGEVGHLHGVCFGYSSLVLKLFSRDKEWICKTPLEKDMLELTTWKFISEEYGQQRTEFDLGVNCSYVNGTQIISLYAPFWMINKTGKRVTYGSKDPLNEVYHPSGGPVDLSSIPLMFSYTSNNGGLLSGKRKAKIRVEDSNWSDFFTLDTIEDGGKIICERKSNAHSEKYNIGVNIAMSKSSLTKIITFTPFYVIRNTTNFSIECKELDTGKFNVQIGPQEATPFWPVYGAKAIVLKIGGTEEITTPFSLEMEHTTLLMLSNRYGGLNVEVRISNSETMLTISEYKTGDAPVLLINHTSCVMIEYGEFENCGSRQFLPPGEKAFFTWTNPAGSRALAWSLAGAREEYVNYLNKSDQGYVQISNQQIPGTGLGWVSFLEGMQRVLLFTEDTDLCVRLSAIGENERLSQEIEVSIAGIGLSLVNNLASHSRGEKNYEIIYMRMSSSDIVWEIRKQGKSRYKPLTRSQCEAIEADFQKYSREKTVAKAVNESRKIRTVSELLIRI